MANGLGSRHLRARRFDDGGLADLAADIEHEQGGRNTDKESRAPRDFLREDL